MTHTHRLDEMVADVRAHAATPEHAWDERAIDWPLTEDSVVVEVGGYQGRWALQIAERYHPRLFVFEPQPWAAAVASAALQGTGALVLNYALGTTSGAMLMGEWETDGCSLVKDGAEHPCVMVEIGATFRQLEIEHIDLMLMNIEGYEYTLLPHMLSVGILPKRLMVQFHAFDGGDGVRMAQIYIQLEQLGYQIVWTYGVMLTAWERA